MDSVLHRQYELYKRSKEGIKRINRRYHELQVQIAAIRAAANGLMGEMVEIHLQDELVSGDTTPEQRAARMAEVGHLLRSYLK